MPNNFFFYIEIINIKKNKFNSNFNVLLLRRRYMGRESRARSSLSLLITFILLLPPVLTLVTSIDYPSLQEESQNSKYNYLLNPKSGGIGLALTTMPYIKLTIDFTIVYHSDVRTFWDFLCGRMSKVTIKVREVDIPSNLLGKDYEEDIRFRDELKTWMENLWREKDKYIEELKHD